MMRKLGNIGNDKNVFFSGTESAELLGKTSSPGSTSATSSSGQSSADDKKMQSWEVCGVWATENAEESDDDGEMEKAQSDEDGMNKVEDDIDRILLELDADLNGEEEEDGDDSKNIALEKPKSDLGVVDIIPEQREMNASSR